MKTYVSKDIAVIGAGIIGCTIARELSRFDKSVIVIDKEADVGWGTTKANSGIIHAGYAGDDSKLRFKLSHKGNVLFRKYAEELEIPIKNIGSLVSAYDKQSVNALEVLRLQGIRNGLKKIEIIADINKIKKFEPNISNSVKAALYANEACIIEPYGAAISLFESSKQNGVDFIFDSEVTSIDYDQLSRVFHIKATKIDVHSQYVINAAGVFSDVLSNMIGDNSFKINPIKGEYLLLDKVNNGFINSINFHSPGSKTTKGILVAPTISGNIIIGPNYEQCSSKEDLSTTKDGMTEIRRKALELFPKLPIDTVISNFAGLRAVSDTGDFVIGPSPLNNKFINVAGIQSPGLTCAFAISEIVLRILKDSGIKFKKNKKFVPIRRKIKRLNLDNLNKNNSLIRDNKLYGEIVCRCENVTEAEIIESIKRGATTVDGIKFRTRAGMGRCQGGYCALRIINILSRELNIPFESVTKNGDGSYFAKYRMN
jgi:glycerol-3-phosphate dehydrogenase